MPGSHVIEAEEWAIPDRPKPCQAKPSLDISHFFLHLQISRIPAQWGESPMQEAENK